VSKPTDKPQPQKEEQDSVCVPTPLLDQVVAYIRSVPSGQHPWDLANRLLLALAECSKEQGQGQK